MKRKLLFILIIVLISILHSCEKSNNINLTVTDYDGNIYKTVKIGNQVWMAENLKTTHYADGTVIQLVEDGSVWYNADKAMCYYNNSLTNKDTYGALYSWAAAMNGSTSSEANPSNVQGVCPSGWHLPSDNEWKELEMYLGMSKTEVDMYNFRGTNEGSKLAGDSSLWNKEPIVNSNELLVNNVDFGTSGFMAFPSGYRSSSNGISSQLGDIADFWSATESGDKLALTRLMHFYNTRVHRFTDFKETGRSVRCVKD